MRDSGRILPDSPKDVTLCMFSSGLFALHVQRAPVANISLEMESAKSQN